MVSNEPLWLTVERDGKSTSYEFPPGGDDTTVVVGSSVRAQIRIAGVAPIAFYVERVENDLCVTSCYLGSDLCIDGRVVSGRYTIVRCVTIELADVRLRLSVRDNPPTLPGYYVDATTEIARVSTRSAPATRPLARAIDPSGEPLAPSALAVDPSGEPLAPSDSSAEARDAYLSALDAWFDATFLSDHECSDVPPNPAPPKLEEPSAVRAGSALLKRVTVPPRPRPTMSPRSRAIVRRPYSDFAQTQELAPIQLLAIAEELKTVEFGPASSHSEAPTERAIRLGSATSPAELDAEPVVTPESVGADITTRLLPSAPPRKRRPLLFLLGAALGTVLPALCLVGVGRLQILSRNTSATRTQSTYAAATADSRLPMTSAVSTTAASAALQPSVATPATSVPSPSKVPNQVPRFKKRYSGSAASAQ